MQQTLRTLLIDDEAHAIETMRILLTENFPEIEIVGEASKLIKAVELINKLNPQVIFLDISMSEGTGFDLLEALGSRDFQVIFVTAHQEYAIHAIKQNAFDYLLKPIQLQELATCIEKLQVHFSTSNAVPKHQRISISTLESTEFINIEDIVYCKSDNSYTTIYLSNTQSLLTSKSLKTIQNNLPEQLFKRCHNSYLVNKNFVKRHLKKDESIQLRSGEQLPLSRSKRDMILSWLED